MLHWGLLIKARADAAALYEGSEVAMAACPGCRSLEVLTILYTLIADIRTAGAAGESLTPCDVSEANTAVHWVGRQLLCRCRVGMIYSALPAAAGV